MTIYFVRAGKDGPVKIGYTSRDVVKRVSQMQIGSHIQMVLVGTIDGTFTQERALQARFKNLHLRGEWFMVEGELDQFLAALPPPITQPHPRAGLLKKREGRAFSPVGYRRGRGRSISPEKFAELERLLKTTNIPTSNIARSLGLKPSIVFYHFPNIAEMRPSKPPAGRHSLISPAQFKQIEHMLLVTKDTIPEIAARIKIRGKSISPSTINHHFPGWRTKLVKERKAWRRHHPLPQPPEK